jgi:AcrR family transcriptional regulator
VSESAFKGLRKAPQQARSRARVQAIFDAADRVLAGEGVEAVTMRRIAEDAGVPIGTVYQFFEDKSAVLSALAQHYMDGFEETMAEAVEAASLAPLEDLVDIVFDRFVERYRRHPGYVAIWTGRHLSPELLRADDANNDLLAESVRRILLSRSEVVDGPQLTLACRAAVRVADALLQLAFRIDPHGDQDTLEEAKRLDRLYVTEIVTSPRFR